MIPSSQCPVDLAELSAFLGSLPYKEYKRNKRIYTHTTWTVTDNNNKKEPKNRRRRHLTKWKDLGRPVYISRLENAPAVSWRKPHQSVGSGHKQSYPFLAYTLDLSMRVDGHYSSLK
jgi:hypothetical protein